MYQMEQIANGIWKVTLGETEQFTPCGLIAPQIRREALKELPEQTLPPTVLERLEFKKTVRGACITLPMDTKEDIYGFGLQLRSLNQAGRKRTIKVNSDPVADTGESHAPAPFYVSTAGYGIYVDTYRYTTFYMGTNTNKGSSSEKKEVNQAHKEFSESAIYALKKAKEERNIIIDIAHAPGVTLYVFAGAVKEVVQRYILFCGGGVLPPMWGLGMWYRSYGGSNQDTIVRTAEDFRKDDMPVDVLGLEPGWHSHSYSCTYDWSYLFPNPQEMIDKVKKLGYELNLWEHIFVYPASEIYEDLLPYAGDYEVWNGLIPDFSMNEACEIFGKLHSRKFIQKGIGGFKLDECDNSDYNPSNWSFPDTTEFPSGMDGEQMHMAVGGLYQKLLYELFKKENRRTYSQVRSSGALSASLPFVLYSDLYNHKQFIRGMVTSGFSGMLWAPEVRNCKNEQDLFRRLQTIVFSEHALLNCWRIPGPPWKQVDIQKNLAGEWMETQEYCTEVCRRYFKLRKSLLPYLYSAYAEYYLYGIPPIRALVMDYPEDEKVRNCDTQYMFGSSMLVAPLVYEEGERKNVYLPQGIWYDLFTGKKYEGGNEYEIYVSYEDIPVFVKEGTLLPMAEPVSCIDETTVFKLHMLQFGEETEAFVLYEDDFVSFDYEYGKMNKVTVSVTDTGELVVNREGKETVRYEFKKNAEAGKWSCCK